MNHATFNLIVVIFGSASRSDWEGNRGSLVPSGLSFVGKLSTICRARLIRAVVNMDF